MEHPIFHLYNRSNDRQMLFKEDQNYQFFLAKMKRQFAGRAHILAYCIMPNHFHLVLTPVGTIERRFESGRIYRHQPNADISKAVAAWLMGFTKSYNKFYGISGSRFRKLTRLTYHDFRLRTVLQYCHYNPVKAKLVDHPHEWGFSSAIEYSGLLKPEDCICDVELGRQIMSQNGRSDGLPTY